jgi:hypothetical protein
MRSTSLLPEARRGPQEVTDFASTNTLVFDPETEVWVAAIPGRGPDANVRQILGRGTRFACTNPAPPG